MFDARIGSGTTVSVVAQDTETKRNKISVGVRNRPKNANRTYIVRTHFLQNLVCTHIARRMGRMIPVIGRKTV